MLQRGTGSYVYRKVNMLTPGYQREKQITFQLLIGGAPRRICGRAEVLVEEVRPLRNGPN